MLGVDPIVALAAVGAPVPGLAELAPTINAECRVALDRESAEGGADLIVAGSIDDIAEGLAAYVAAGVTDLRLGITARHDDERLATAMTSPS